MTITNLTDAASISVDGSQGPVFSVTLGGSHKLANPSNLVAGQVYRFLVFQDSAGGHALDYDSSYRFSHAAKPDLSTTSNALSIVSFLCDGTYLNEIASSFDCQTIILAPSGLTASTNQAGVINLSWTNNAADQTSLYVEIQNAIGGWDTIANVAAGATTYADNEAPGTYNYRVYAERNGYYSEPSNLAVGTCS